MKRFLALLALALVLLAGTAGMASALTLDFDDGIGQAAGTAYIPPSGSPILNVDMLNWHDEGGGHLYCELPQSDSAIRFTGPTYVNKFEMNGQPWADSGAYNYGPMDLAAFEVVGGQWVEVWMTTVEFTAPPEENSYSGNWFTVVVDRPNVSKIIFCAHGEVGWGGQPNFIPSIDNLVYGDPPAVPIPASVWLLASGLLALVGLRRKFTR